MSGTRQWMYQELEAANPSHFDGLVNSGINETGYKKGPKYMAVVINHDTVSVAWCGKGIEKQSSLHFFEPLIQAPKASICCASNEETQ